MNAFKRAYIGKDNQRCLGECQQQCPKMRREKIVAKLLQFEKKSENLDRKFQKSSTSQKCNGYPKRLLSVEY